MAEKIFTQSELRKVFANSQDGNHLMFIYNRLAEVHNEDTHIDYMRKLREIIGYVHENIMQGKKQYVIDANKFDAFIADRKKTASSTISEAAYIIIEGFIKKQNSQS